LDDDNTKVTDPSATRFANRLDEKLANSLAAALPGGTPRQVRLPHTVPNKATAVIGMRRAGKTTFLHQLRRQRLAAGTPREWLPYINFEDEQLVGLEAHHLTLLVDAFYRRFPALRAKERVTWCLDEIQIVPGWERFVRRLLDEERVEVFLSGSSARMLSREIATSMRGRAWEVVIHPFSFEEFLHHHNHRRPERPDLLDAPTRSHLENWLLEYLVVGGFPEAQSLELESRHRLLRDYVDVVMMRDVIERHQVGNVVVLRSLVRQLLANAGGSFSVEKFHAASKSQGLKVAKETVHELVAHLEDCYLVRSLYVDTDSERRRMVNPRKVYPIDPGLIPVFDRVGKPNLGHALETVVLIELERRGRQITYVRNQSGTEVDFMARSARGDELIQVCADARDPATMERELRGLDEAGSTYPRARRRLLVAMREGLPGQVPSGVVAQTVSEWLLMPDGD
jgi:predicted AAA+ superfamily ATPase